VFVIVGRPSGRALVHDVRCPFMTDDAFRAKVLDRGGRKGRYVWAANARVAIETSRGCPVQAPGGSGLTAAG
jgi:hypothetical protein